MPIGYLYNKMFNQLNNLSMNKPISKILVLAIIIVLTGCAATYRPINPSTINYNAHELQDGISLAYRYEVLREKGNKKYAKKEAKKGIKLIAVKVTNNTDSTINIGKDFAFYSGQNQLFPMEPIAIKESIKQFVPGYLPYFLLTFLNFTYTESANGTPSNQDVYHVGYVLGPAVTIGNLAVAGTANKKMLDELSEYNILNRDIQKGETVYGIICVRDIGYIPLSVKRINKTGI